MSDDQFLALTTEERALLDDPERQEQFTLIPVGGRLLDKLRGERLTWRGVSFGGSKWNQAYLVDCTFAGVDFSDSNLDAVQFERCNFSECRFERTRLVGVRFVDCRLDETFWRDAQVDEASLERTSLTGAWFEGGSFRLHMHGGALSETRFSDSRIEALQLSETTVRALRLSGCRTDRLVLQHCSVDRLQLLGGNCDSLNIYGGKLRDVKWGELQCRRGALEDVEDIASLYINTCGFERLEFDRCMNVADLYIYKTHVQTLSIQRSRISGWFTDSTLQVGSSVTEGVLDNFFWDASVCEGLTLRGVRLVGLISARQTRFMELRLIDLEYTPGVTLLLDDASFDRSDIFQASQP